MNIKSEDIKEIKTIGTLFDDEVKLVTTVGGFNIAIGKKESYSKAPQALAAGNHIAIVSHEVQKKYGSSFQPSLCKSEQDEMPEVKEFTSKLPESYIDSGFEVHTLTKNEKSDIILSRNGLDIMTYSASINGDCLDIKKGSSVLKHKNENIIEVFKDLFGQLMQENKLKKLKVLNG